MKFQASKSVFSLLLCVLFITLTVTAQAPNRALQLFEPFLEGEWKITGGDLGGAEFNQKINFKKNLQGNIIETESYSLNDQKKWELRNKGVRYFDRESQALRFSEWTVLGEATHGLIIQRQDSIEYQYNYAGMELRDVWIPVSRDTYEFMVGVVKDGKWQKVLLKTKAIRLQ